MAKVDASIADVLKIFIDKIGKEGIHVDSAYLFGSYAKGRADKWSDIDVAIVSADITDDSFAEMVRFTKIASKIDTRIEPVPFRPENFIDEDPLVWEIKKEGMALPV